MLPTSCDWIKKSRYGRNYSRVLIRMGGQNNLKELEISISPINPWEGAKRDIGIMSLRLHRTTDIQDMFSHVVPDEVYNDLVEQFGEEHADFILNAPVVTGVNPLIRHYERIIWNMMSTYISYGGGVPLGILRPDIDIIGNTVDWTDSEHMNTVKKKVKAVTGITLTRDTVCELHMWLMNHNTTCKHNLQSIDYGLTSEGTRARPITTPGAR